MVVLHICPLSDDLSNGVHIAVPQHVKAQRKYVDAALWNLGQPLKIDGLEQVFSAASLEQLPPPYCRPDLAVFHELYIPRYLSLAKQLRRQNIPYIIVPHGALKKNAQKKSRLKKTAANLLLFKRFCNQAAGIQCLTEQEKAQSVMGKRIFIAPNGINPPPKTKTEFHIWGVRFVYVGRILPYIKGLDLMLQAFGAQKDFLARHGCTLDIYGPADDRGVSYLPEMKRLIAQNGVDELVTLHPAVFGGDKHRVLLDADVFIQTSRTEGMPMGVLEALSYGLPCLLSEGTTFAQTVADCDAGWNAGKTESTIAATLRQAVHARQHFPEFSQNALALSRQYSWDAAAKTAVGAYQSCVTSSTKER